MSVYLVGAGPGHRDLLTLRAARLLEIAAVVVHDGPVDAPVLAVVRDDTVLIDVGKRWGRSGSQDEINRQLIDRAQRYEAVGRLNGGDPFLFGRGTEEWVAQHATGIETSLLGEGRSPQNPVPAVRGACTPTERTTRAKLVDLGGLDVGPPAVNVVGPVAACNFPFRTPRDVVLLP